MACYYYGESLQLATTLSNKTDVARLPRAVHGPRHSREIMERNEGKHARSSPKEKQKAIELFCLFKIYFVQHIPL